MKAFLFLILFFPVVSGFANAATVTVNTGYGYYVKNGVITDKAQLPRGVHKIADGYSYVEVKSQAELDAVKIAPKEVPVEAQIEKNRQDYIDALIAGNVEKQVEIQGKAIMRARNSQPVP